MAVGLALEHPDRVAAVADVVAIARVGFERPARGERDRVALQLLHDLARLQVPHQHRIRERLRIPFVQRAHERLLRHPARRDHAVELGLDDRLVRIVRRLVARDKLAVVGEFRDAAGSAAVRPGSHADQHAPRNRVRRMRPRQARQLRHVVDRADQFRVHRVGPHVEDEEPAGVQRSRPDLAAIVGVAHVVRFVADRADFDLSQDLAVGDRRQIRVDHGKVIAALPDGQRPQVHHLLRVFQALDVRRQAGFGECGSGHDGGGQRQRQRIESSHDLCTKTYERAGAAIIVPGYGVGPYARLRRLGPLRRGEPSSFSV